MAKDSLKVRLGIRTGLVVVGEMGAGEFREQAAIVGDTPNTAARLQELAEPDSVVISGATYQLVRGLFDCESLGPRPLKGLSNPVQVYRVLRESQAHSRFDVAMQAGLTPLVGRENESAILRSDGNGPEATKARWCPAGWPMASRARQSISARMKLVPCQRRTRDRQITPGPDLQRANCEGEEQVAECHCSPYHQNSAHYPIIDLLQRFLEFESPDDSSARSSKLER
jgi:adenylate/guanylate cyclase family protein